MNPPRTLLLCDRLDSAGGVERFVAMLANHLAALGWPVALGTAGTPRDALAFPLDERVRVLHGASVLPLGDGALPLLQRQWRTGRVLARLALDERPDVLLLNGLTTAASALLFMPGWLRARAVACDHNHFFARSALWQRLRARLYPQVAAVVSLTQADRARFAALNPRTEVIHNASPIAPQALPPAAGETVLAIGRCVAQKGFDRLLAAWPAVHAARPAARLAIVGDGPLRRELQAQAGALGIADTLRWVAPTHDIVAQHAQAALFVLPSRYEGLPLVLLEAQALGRAAVAFDCPTGPAEVIEHGVTGLLVPEGDVAGLAAAIAELLADPARRAAMGAAAVERSRERFSLDAMLSAWTALLQRAARPGAAHG